MPVMTAHTSITIRVPVDVKKRLTEEAWRRRVTVTSLLLGPWSAEKGKQPEPMLAAGRIQDVEPVDLADVIEAPKAGRLAVGSVRKRMTVDGRSNAPLAVYEKLVRYDVHDQPVWEATGKP